MTFKAREFCQAYQIPYTEEGKHARRDWIQVACPLCTGSKGWHGGFNVSDRRFKGEYRCWRCGWHWTPNVIVGLLSVDLETAKHIHTKYRGKEISGQERQTEWADKCVLPSGCRALSDRARKYLAGRGFDPDYLSRTWGIVATGNSGSYSHRIVAPITYNGRLVSYQARDITGKSEMPYKACEMEDEVIHHKHTLYGLDQAKEIGDTCIIVEGLFDVWALGPGAVGTFGIEYKAEQVRMARRNFKKAFILFDSEEQAQEKAEQLYVALSGFIEVEILELPEKYADPGEIPRAEAREIMADLFNF